MNAHLWFTDASYVVHVYVYSTCEKERLNIVNTLYIIALLRLQTHGLELHVAQTASQRRYDDCKERERIYKATRAENITAFAYIATT